MTYEKRDRGLLVAILVFCQVIRTYLHFSDNGWSNPSNTITYNYQLIDMTQYKGDKHFRTLNYTILGP